MGKRAYYAEYPDKGIASIVKIDEDSEEVWTAERPNSDAFIAYLRSEGYEVTGWVCSAYLDKEKGRTRRKWHPVDAYSEGVQKAFGSLQNMQTPEAASRAAGDDSALVEDDERPSLRLDILPSLVG